MDVIGCHYRSHLKGNKMKYLFIISGIILMLGAAWGGAYFINVYPYGTWQNFPVFITALGMFTGGWFIAGYGVMRP